MTSEEITFTDTPRSELERTIEELVERAQRVLVTQSRLRSLLRANRVVVEELELPEVLRRIVEAAIELLDAQYGALGVIGSDGLLEQFIHVGMAEDDVTAIGRLPVGHGLLGAVIETAAPIRLDHLADDPRSGGFPQHHPQMDGFLGVPIRVRDEVYGNLYLTNPESGRFTHEDEELLSVLAATAGIAIENARLYDEARRAQRWSEALASVTAALQSGDSDDSLVVVVDHVARLVDAALVCIVVAADDPDQLRIAAALGDDADRLRDRTFPASGTVVGRALSEGVPILTTGEETGVRFEWQPEVGPAFVIPLEASGTRIGALTVSRGTGRPHFTESDLRLATEFSRQASVALELTRARADRQQLELVDDRTRIARDLHDHVIQRLFGAGLSLQAMSARAPDEFRAELHDQVEVIDAAISEIRTVVFALSSQPAGRRESLRRRLLDIAREAGGLLGSAPRVSFDGAIDVLVRGELADDVAAVVRESLANVVRHADARTADVVVTVDGEHLIVRVDDDGQGFHPGEHVGGTSNLDARATALGGEYLIEARKGGGTSVTWRVPLRTRS